MASPSGIVNGLLRKLAASPNFITNVRQLPLANATEHSPSLTLSWRNLLVPSLGRDPPVDLLIDLC
jgi:hypothetical protein